ncbi:Hypothetical predicted protein [Scomber scombrus]|uniref:Uncharacterized protein n=1 Tax=Scomber scombrus TaxID=13677 RepID=A0AAV1NSL2_SCOSC
MKCPGRIHPVHLLDRQLTAGAAEKNVQLPVIVDINAVTTVLLIDSHCWLRCAAVRCAVLRRRSGRGYNLVSPFVLTLDSSVPI